ncbi:hypothetical protein PoB_006281100 [Plakobranchus ocellatus]|uniref:MULE transposase domain-containing protein n=1 Tax=Plakobranchus ocellatus TaxID=259542 RepID=A0AAV4CWR6_9GAST|nr:hypothetical protein PoB_006281100 [Plakobranchus ocellatus]
MQEIKHGALTKTPAEIYDQTADGNRLTDGVRNKRQIINAKSMIQQQSGAGCDVVHKIFADQIAGVENLQNSLPFVKAVIRRHAKVPCIILYDDQQMQDILRFCCPLVTCLSTVLSFDKTFNLGQANVTLAVYKNLSVYRRTTNKHPVFCEPMFLHWEPDVTTFFTFFHHLKGQMILSQGNENQTLPVLGSDEEKAMRIALAKAFPDTQRLACVPHIEAKLLGFMQDKIGMLQNQRRQLKFQLFQLVTSALDYIDLIDSLCDFESKITQKKLADHIKKRIHPLLVESKKAIQKPDLDNTNPLWMNNCCESGNHILKQAVSWKSQKLVDLIHKLHSVVQRQFKELRRALTDAGEFVLCPDFAKFKISRNVWLNLEQKQKLNKNIKNFHVHFSELCPQQRWTKSIKRTKAWWT